MDELVRWLGEQLDQEEAAAYAAGHLLTGHLALKWEATGSHVWPQEQVEGVQAKRVVAGDLMEEMPGYEVARARALHIAEHDPDRVMGEIDAKRQIVRWHYRRPAPKWDTPKAEGFECATCDQQFPCKTLRLLALPYADRPGYREGWRP
ncbi:DUF6221 family protein [Streptomyces sp. NPDC021218]|uniref:DUF6221 family protein n=1 Tax=Streptomyces sp. NPDC021218 TaxID=3365119 RepID=UPI00379D7616